MIQIQDLEVFYGDKLALDIHQEIQIEAGDKVGIIGSNGAGKTTLVRSIMEMIPYRGVIHKKVDKEQIGIHSQHTNYIEQIPIHIIMEMILGHSIKEDTKVLELLRYFDFEKCLHRKW